MVINRLTARQVTLVPGKRVQLCDGAGLWFHRADDGNAYWSWRYRSPVSGRDRSFGLGPAHTITLAQAREAAAECRRQVRAGIDPLEARKADKAARRAAAAESERTFRKVAEQFIPSYTAGLSNAKAAAQWASSMEAYVYPKIGGSPVAAITKRDIVGIFDQPHNGGTTPIGEAIPETASRVRQRIEQILTYAKNMGYRSGDNPATKDVLPKRSKKASLVNHHAAMKYDEVPAFFDQLADAKGMAAIALRFTILAAARTAK